VNSHSILHSSFFIYNSVFANHIQKIKNIISDVQFLEKINEFMTSKMNFPENLLQTLTWFEIFFTKLQIGESRLTRSQTNVCFF